MRDASELSLFLGTTGESFQFLRPTMLWVGAGVTVLLVVLYLLMIWRARRKFPGDRAVLRATSVFPSVLLRIAVLSLLVVETLSFAAFFAWPVRLHEVREPLCRGPYIFFARDASDSMKRENAISGAPQLLPFARPNLYSVATAKIKDIVERMDCFQAALTDFQGHAGLFTRFTPIPEKRSAFLADLWAKPTIFPGSDYIPPLRTAVNLVEATPGAPGHTVLVLFSDGGDEQETAKELVRERANASLFPRLQKNRIRVFAVGMGNTARDIMTAYDPTVKQFREWRDERGNRVYVQRYDPNLVLLAQMTGGEYFVMTQYGEIRPRGGGPALEERLAALVQKERVVTGERKTSVVVEDYGWYFFAFGTAAFFLTAGFVNWFFKVGGAFWRILRQMLVA